MSIDEYDSIPDVRDGLTRQQRVILYCLDQLQKERGDRNVPTAMLYGRVVELLDISESDMTDILQHLQGNALNPEDR